jgi:hypothetical protein
MSVASVHTPVPGPVQRSGLTGLLHSIASKVSPKRKKRPATFCFLAAARMPPPRAPPSCRTHATTTGASIAGSTHHGLLQHGGAAPGHHTLLCTPHPFCCSCRSPRLLRRRCSCCFSARPPRYTCCCSIARLAAPALPAPLDDAASHRQRKEKHRALAQKPSALASFYVYGVPMQMAEDAAPGYDACCKHTLQMF